MAHKKKNVRKKECPVCEREFSWTKKLDKNWESMVYCSDQCRRVKKYEGLDHKKEDRQALIGSQRYTGKREQVMAHKKINLPQKICPVCQRPFTWRKKWEKDWEQVIYCSEKCQRGKIKNE